MRILLISSLLVSATAWGSGALHTDGPFFRDASGAVVILRGVNVAGNSKVPPFTPIMDPAALDPLPQWGLNAIRLLFTWEAFEPQPGQDSASYLAYVRGVVEAAHARGLYVIVDFHQDAYSRFSLQGCGEGFPAWALPPGIAAATPDDGADCASWGSRAVGDAGLASTWSGFYADAGGVRSAYLAMLTRVATALANEPAVIGYDLLNEPAGDEASEVAPLYEDAARAVRAGDPQAILFVTPGVLTDVGTATKLPKPTFSNFAYAPHFYDASTYLGVYSGDDESAPFDAFAKVGAAWNVPVLLGEFGASPSVDGVDAYLGAVHRQLDRRLFSGAQWGYTPGWTESAKDGWNQEDFSIVDGEGRLRANFRPRPFASRIAGTPTSLDVEEGASADASSLTLVWQNDPVAGATEIFAPGSYFGGDVSIDAGGDVRCEKSGDRVSCSSPTAGPKQVKIGADRRCGLTGGELLLILFAWIAFRERKTAT